MVRLRQRLQTTTMYPEAMTSTILLVISAFLACSVEAVEALTIVLAVGITHNWRTSLTGVFAALVALTVVIAALGPSLVHYVPIDDLRIFVGALLLVFGLQWLRKAVLRASGLKSLHDEAAIFERELAELEAIPVAPGALDWAGFVVSFKGVFLEGLEVAFIVLTFRRIPATRQPWVGASCPLLSSTSSAPSFTAADAVPENAIKFSVGIALNASVPSRVARVSALTGPSAMLCCRFSQWFTALPPGFSSSPCRNVQGDAGAYWWTRTSALGRSLWAVLVRLHRRGLDRSRYRRTAGPRHRLSPRRHG